jgi:hypothetical protein
MTLSESGLVAATATVRTRAWADYMQCLSSRRFGILVALLGILGAGLGALAPNDASVGRQVATAIGGAIAAVILAYSTPLLFLFLRTPFRQRRELVGHLQPGNDPEPDLVLEPKVDLREEKPMGLKTGPVPVRSLAYLRAYNAREEGGDAAKAEHVAVEIKVFAPGDELVYQGKGWETGEWREFSTGREEDAVWVVAKWREDEGCFIVRDKKAKVVQALPDGSYVVEITLRCHKPPTPITKRFIFNSGGRGTDLSLEIAQP